jgi:hypothetical protein
MEKIVGQLYRNGNKNLWIISKLVDDPERIQGFQGSSEMLKNYKALKVWQKS